ncbi:hypothetical protein GOP47_0028817, partial [Adiantum capillus-veneris]
TRRRERRERTSYDQLLLRSSPALHLLLLLLLVTSSLFLSRLAATANMHSCHPEDRSALLALETAATHSLYDDEGKRDAWFKWDHGVHADCCEWQGVRCDATTRRVVALIFITHPALHNSKFTDPQHVGNYLPLLQAWSPWKFWTCEAPASPVLCRPGTPWLPSSTSPTWTSVPPNSLGITSLIFPSCPTSGTSILALAIHWRSTFPVYSAPCPAMPSSTRVLP